MFWRRMGGLVAGLVIVTGTVSAAQPGCAPGAACALRLARDLTLERAGRAKDGDELRHWLHMTEWLEKVDSQPDAAAARARILALTERVSHVEDDDALLTRRRLAAAMMAAGLLTEAEQLAATLAGEHRGQVYGELALNRAERGDWREAIRIANAMVADEVGEGDTAFVYHAVVKAVGRTGKPEQVKEAAALFRKPSPVFVPAALALAEVANGNEVGAVALATQQSESGWTAYILDLVAEEYRAKHREPDALRIERILLERVRADAPQLWFEQRVTQYVDRSIKAGQHRQALDVWPLLPEPKRRVHFTSAILGLRTAEDVAVASGLASRLTGHDRAEADLALIWARIMAGLVDPATALKELPDPDLAARRFIEWLVLAEGVDPTRGRALLAAALTQRTPAERSPFEPLLETRARTRLGLLDDARQTARSFAKLEDRAEALLEISAAYSAAGQASAARETEAEALRSWTQLSEAQSPGDRIDVLIRHGFADEAETELRRQWAKNRAPESTFYGRVDPLLRLRLARGETTKAFGLAVDWADRTDDPEALATLYSLLQKTEPPPPKLYEILRHVR